MVVPVIDDTELPRGDPMDGIPGMDGIGVGSGLFHRTRQILRGMSDLEGDIRAWNRHGQPVDVMHAEVTFVGRFRIISMRDI